MWSCSWAAHPSMTDGKCTRLLVITMLTDPVLRRNVMKACQRLTAARVGLEATEATGVMVMLLVILLGVA